VAAALNKPASSYSFYEDEYKKPFLPIDLVQALIPLFGPHGVEPDELLALAGVTPMGLATSIKFPIGAPKQEARQNVHGSDALDPLPILGVAEGGPDGLLEWNGEVIGQIPRPPYLVGARNAYALYVMGTSMVPRYHQGELIHVHPGKPVTPGCFVVAQIQRDNASPTPAALVKQFVKQDERQLILHQLNPAKDLKITSDQVRTVHRIVGSSES
jgi:phage repressor protein C with HTH and peptisase S24 domain